MSPTRRGHGPPLVVDGDDPEAIAYAAKALREGAVIAMPTDTVYGLAAALDQPVALQRLYLLKDRPGEKTIPVLISDLHVLETLTHGLPLAGRHLVTRYWPGPLTVVCTALPDLPAEVTSTARMRTTVAVRLPDHDLARAIIRAAGGRLAVTSANTAGEPPAQSAEDCTNLAGGTPDLIVDGGPSRLGVPSTIVSFVDGISALLREGAIPGSEIEIVLQESVPSRD